MEPAIANYKNHVQGDTINSRRFTITKTINGVESPVDLTDAVIRSHFINRTSKRLLSIGDGISVIDASNGIFEIDSFSLNKSGKWEYDVEIKFPNGAVKTYVKGTINILNDVTK